MRTGDDEARSPKYAHVEPERRRLIDPGTRPPLPAAHAVIKDRHATGTRIRLTGSLTGATALTLTKKYDAADPLARPIVTAYLTAEEFALLATLPAAVPTKRRHERLADDLIWSVDRLAGGARARRDRMARR